MEAWKRKNAELQYEYQRYKYPKPSKENCATAKQIQDTFEGWPFGYFCNYLQAFSYGVSRYGLVILLFTFIFLVGEKVFAYDFYAPNNEGFTLYYNYINNGKELELTYEHYDSGRNYEHVQNLDKGILIIPEEVTYMNRTRKVTQIGEAALAHTWIKKIIMPKTIKSIEDFAFWNCHELHELVIPDSVETIGNHVCDYVSIKKIVVGKGLKTVAGTVGHASLDTVIVKDITAFLNIDFKSGNFFSGSKNLLYSYDNKLITHLTLPNGITKIGKSLRKCKSLQSVTIPSSITEIDKYAFYGCSNLTYVYMHDNINTIGEEAFYECNISEITFPKNLTSIEGRAFYSCKFTSIDLPPNLIKANGFDYCTLLTAVTLPDKIKEFYFSSCKNVLTVVSKIKNPEETTCGNNFNKNTLMNATLYVPVGTKAKYMAAEGWKDFVFIEEGSPTGILPIEESNTNIIETKRYTLNGQQISQPHKGINIIRTSEGTTKKVMVK